MHSRCLTHVIIVAAWFVSGDNSCATKGRQRTLSCPPFPDRTSYSYANDWMHGRSDPHVAVSELTWRSDWPCICSIEREEWINWLYLTREATEREGVNKLTVLIFTREATEREWVNKLTVFYEGSNQIRLGVFHIHPPTARTNSVCTKRTHERTKRFQTYPQICKITIHQHIF